jgi:predicted GNAT family N-acyltransferase
MQFFSKPFLQLSVTELYEAYALRSAVFVVEQNCPYQDPDDKDLKAFHVLMRRDDLLAGYARILPPGISYQEPSIGRVVVHRAQRGRGAGQELMKYCLQQAQELFKRQDIVISAQLYLLRFYSNLGFSAEGAPYPEDNIPHIKMRYKASL